MLEDQTFLSYVSSKINEWITLVFIVFLTCVGGLLKYIIRLKEDNLILKIKEMMSIEIEERLKEKFDPLDEKLKNIQNFIHIIKTKEVIEQGVLSRMMDIADKLEIKIDSMR